MLSVHGGGALGGPHRCGGLGRPRAGPSVPISHAAAPVDRQRSGLMSTAMALALAVAVAGTLSLSLSLSVSMDRGVPLCRGLFCEPVALPCGHTFCLRYVQGLLLH